MKRLKFIPLDSQKCHILQVSKYAPIFFINKEQVIRNVDDNHLQSNHFFMMSNWKFFPYPLIHPISGGNLPNRPLCKILKIMKMFKTKRMWTHTTKRKFIFIVQPMWILEETCDREIMNVKKIGVRKKWRRMKFKRICMIAIIKVRVFQQNSNRL